MKAYLWVAGLCAGAWLAAGAAAAEDLTYCKQAIETQQAGNLALAIEQINKCIDAGGLEFQNLGIALGNRGKALADLNRPDGAIEDFIAALRLRPDNRNATYPRAHAYHKFGQLAAAIDDYTTVLRLNPADTDAYLYSGAAFHDLGQYSRAVEDYSTALRLAPKDRDALFARRQAYLQLGEETRAAEDLKAAGQ